MKIRKTLIAFLMITVLLAFTACGSSGGDSSDAQDADAGAQTEEAQAEDTEPAINPYAWMGLQDMPKCNYLDILSTYHYIQTYDAYTLGVTTEVTEAVDGINTFTDNSGTKSYSIDGHITSVNDNAKIYMEYDMGGTAEDARKKLEEAMTTGNNIFGRNYLGTGKGTIPGYQDSGDTAEYEYYEYDYPQTEEAGSGKIIERYYMKDGDVFAMYRKTTTDSSEVEYTSVIKSISGDIPAGTFDLPDLSEYTKYES